MSHANTTNEPSTSEVFQVVTLSSDTFIIQSTPAQQSRGGESTSSGKVNCSLSFASTDGHACLAIGCEEGLWIGYRDDSQSLRHASHLNLKMVTQCAMLERFGVFLVLVDQSLFAYDIESLVPSSLESANTSHTPEKLNDTRGVQFFSVGILAERTLVLYMIKDGSDSVFHALDIIVGNDNDGGPLTAQLDLPEYRSRWFRVYRVRIMPISPPPNGVLVIHTIRQSCWIGHYVVSWEVGRGNINWWSTNINKHQLVSMPRLRLGSARHQLVQNRTTQLAADSENCLSRSLAWADDLLGCHDDEQCKMHLCTLSMTESMSLSDAVEVSPSLSCATGIRRFRDAAERELSA